jgi:hypothetical protein
LTRRANQPRDGTSRHLQDASGPARVIVSTDTRAHFSPPKQKLAGKGITSRYLAAPWVDLNQVEVPLRDLLKSAGLDFDS